MSNNHDYFHCLLVLKSKGINIGHELKILDLRYSENVGIGSWGMIDFLCKKHGFTIAAGLPHGKGSIFTKILGGPTAYAAASQNRG